MIDNDAATLALRNRARALSVCTTGSTTLSATATGYARTSGSFITDGFAPGMEITVAGFTSNPTDIVKNVQALSMTTVSSRTAESAAAGRTISVGLPTQRAWENIDIGTLTTGRPYLSESYTPQPPTVLSFPPSGATRDDRGLYVLTWYGLPKYGTTAIRKCTDALLALFTPGTTITAGSNTIRIRGVGNEPGPYTSGLIPLASGWTACAINIPWRAFTTNTIT